MRDEHFLDRMRQPAFEGGTRVGGLGGGLALAVVRAAGQERALLIDDGDRLRLQARHRLGDQVLDRHHLLAAEGGGAAHHDEDRGGRLRGLALERLALGQHQVDASVGDAVEGADRARQLAFEGAQIADVFLEAGDAEALLVVEQLIADRSAARQPVGGQGHAQPRRLVGRHQDGRFALHLIGDAHRVEALQHRAGGLRLDAGIERHQRRRRHLHGEIDERQQNGRARAHERDQAAVRQCPQISDQIAHAGARFLPVETRT